MRNSITPIWVYDFIGAGWANVVVDIHVGLAAPAIILIGR